MEEKTPRRRSLRITRNRSQSVRRHMFLMSLHAALTLWMASRGQRVSCSRTGVGRTEGSSWVPLGRRPLRLTKRRSQMPYRRRRGRRRFPPLLFPSSLLLLSLFRRRKVEVRRRATAAEGGGEKRKGTFSLLLLRLLFPLPNPFPWGWVGWPASSVVAAAACCHPMCHLDVCSPGPLPL